MSYSFHQMYRSETQIPPRDYKKNFVLNSAEYEICPASKTQITNNFKFFLAKHS